MKRQISKGIESQLSNFNAENTEEPQQKFKFSLRNESNRQRNLDDDLLSGADESGEEEDDLEEDSLDKQIHKTSAGSQNMVFEEEESK